MFSILFSLIISAASAAVDSAFYHGIYEGPSLQASPRFALSSNSIRVVQWNVHMFHEIKSQNWDCHNMSANTEWQSLCDQIAQSDIFLMQESRDSHWREDADRFLAVENKHLSFAPYAINKGSLGQDFRDYLFISFDEKAERGLVEREPTYWGSATYSAVYPETTQVRMSETPDQDGGIYMPLIATTYVIEGRSERLLTIHFHNMALVGHEEQQDLLDKAEQLIVSHHGPVLFAGDFNSWTTEKMNNVYRLAQRQGLARIDFSSPYCTPFGDRQIDHALVRGLNVSSVQVFNSSRILSDHMAVAYELSVQ